MTKRKPTIDKMDKPAKKQTKGKRVSITVDDGLAAIFYKLPQNEYDYECAINGVAYRSVLWDLDQELRNIAKHGGGTEQKYAERWRTRLWELMNDHGIQL